MTCTPMADGFMKLADAGFFGKKSDLKCRPRGRPSGKKQKPPRKRGALTTSRVACPPTSAPAIGGVASRVPVPPQWPTLSEQHLAGNRPTSKRTSARVSATVRDEEGRCGMVAIRQKTARQSAEKNDALRLSDTPANGTRKHQKPGPRTSQTPTENSRVSAGVGKRSIDAR